MMKPVQIYTWKELISISSQLCSVLEETDTLIVTEKVGDLWSVRRMEDGSRLGLLALVLLHVTPVYQQSTPGLQGLWIGLRRLFKLMADGSFNEAIEI